MLKFSNFSVKKPLLLVFVLMGMALISHESSAQNENEKAEELPSTRVDRSGSEDHTASRENAPVLFNASKPSTSVQKTTTPLAKRDNTTDFPKEGETKKPESPSTLSFNIFLYIVDKFKGD